jgi:predicted nucleic acid-binding protein
MKQVCVDTQTIIWGVRQIATPGQEDMISRAVALFERCRKDGDLLVVPTIVLGELLAAVPLDEHPDFVRLIQGRFLVAPFDAAAALVYGRLWQAHKSEIIPQARKELAGLERAEIKADHMIAAVAVARRCDQLCTADKALIRFAERHISILRLPDVPVQPSLLE